MNSIQSKKESIINHFKKNKWLILVLLTLPQMNPKFLGEFVITDLLVNICRVFSSMGILIWMIAIKKKISFITILIGIQQGFILLLTIIMNGMIQDYAITYFSVLSVVLLYDLAQEDKVTFLSSQLFCFEIVIYINLLTEILYPNSLYITQDELMYVLKKNWFLGFYNNHTQFFLPALMIAFLYKMESGKKNRAYILTGAIYISAILVWSGGVLVALFGMAFVYLFFKNYTKIFSYYNYWLIQIFFFVFVILLKMQNLLKWFIDGILGKWNSLTGRMTLWDIYLKELIPENIIFGHGMVDTIERKKCVGMKWACHAHNQMLEILYQGGVVNLILFIAIVILAGRGVYRNRNSNRNKIIATAFLGWCLHSLVEPYSSPFLMAMFVIAYYSNDRVLLIETNPKCWLKIFHEQLQCCKK